MSSGPAAGGSPSTVHVFALCLICMNTTNTSLTSRVSLMTAAFKGPFKNYVMPAGVFIILSKHCFYQYSSE